MELRLIRKSEEDCTTGKLFVGPEFQCLTLEDPVREIPGVPVDQWKIKKKTAIPAGRYRVTLEHSNRFGPGTITLHSVPGFTAIRMHGGTDEDDTEGCPLVGDRLDGTGKNIKISGAKLRGVLDSLKAKIAQALTMEDEVWITIDNPVEWYSQHGLPGRGTQVGFIAMGALPYLIIGVAIVAIFWAAVRWHAKTHYERGVDAERVQWQKRANKELADAQAKIAELTERARRAEQVAAAALADASNNYQKGVAYGKAETKRRIAGVRDGTVILRDPGAPAAGSQGCGGPAPSPTATASRRDDTEGSQLSAAASEFLLELTGEADDVVRQLKAAQQVIVSYRAACNTDSVVPAGDKERVGGVDRGGVGAGGHLIQSGAPLVDLSLLLRGAQSAVDASELVYVDRHFPPRQVDADG